MIRFALLGFALLVAAPWPAQADAKLPVVATFSILGDLVKSVGGDRVAVETLVGPNADTHAYTPKPTDAKKLAAAKLIFANGLGFEAWIDRLIAGADAKSPVILASRGVTVLNGDSETPKTASNPHAWQSVSNAKIYVANIRDGLIAADPASADVYRANAAAYTGQLDKLDTDIRAAMANVPESRRRIVTPHPSFAYFGSAYGLQVQSTDHSNHEAETSAKTVAEIVGAIKRDRISAIFLETTGDPRLMQQIARETGVKIGGPLYADALTDKAGVAPTYIAMMRQNLREISDALRGPN